MGQWEEIKNPRRSGLECFGGFYRVQGSINRRVQGVLYYNLRAETLAKSHTIIYRSEQRNGEWSQNISDILEIIDDSLPHDEAIERCRKYTRNSTSEPAKT